MTKVLIIEDENKARKAIVNIIKSNIKDVEILDKAEDVQSGLSAIIMQKPDIVLLDINLVLMWRKSTKKFLYLHRKFS